MAYDHWEQTVSGQKNSSTILSKSGVVDVPYILPKGKYGLKTSSSACCTMQHTVNQDLGGSVLVSW